MEALIEKMVAALQQWTCPNCQGAKIVWRPGAQGMQHAPCSTCEGTGLHPAALEALKPYYAEQERLSAQQRSLAEDAAREMQWEEDFPTDEQVEQHQEHVDPKQQVWVDYRAQALTEEKCPHGIPITEMCVACGDWDVPE
jgi:hypothetical protein